MKGKYDILILRKVVGRMRIEFKDLEVGMTIKLKTKTQMRENCVYINEDIYISKDTIITKNTEKFLGGVYQIIKKDYSDNSFSLNIVSENGWGSAYSWGVASIEKIIKKRSDLMYVPVEKILSDKYLEIMERHNNSKWAYDELHYLVYDAYIGEYNNLSESDKKDVNHFMDSLCKISNR